MARWQRTVGLVWTAGLLGLLHVQSASAQVTASPVLSGSVAYAEPVRYDYDRDGILNQVQMWATFEIKPAVGTRGKPGYQPEEGFVRRYLKDIDTGQPVAGYSMHTMLPDTPLGQPIPVSEVSLSGHTMTFTVENYRYTVTDGGPGYEHDSIKVDDGLDQYPVTLFDGDLTISSE